MVRQHNATRFGQISRNVHNHEILSVIGDIFSMGVHLLILSKNTLRHTSRDTFYSFKYHNSKNIGNRSCVQISPHTAISQDRALFALLVTCYAVLRNTSPRVCLVGAHCWDTAGNPTLFPARFQESNSPTLSTPVEHRDVRTTHYVSHTYWIYLTWNKR